LYTLNPCVTTKFGFIAHMLLLIAHVLLLTAHRSLLVAHKIAIPNPKSAYARLAWPIHRSRTS